MSLTSFIERDVVAGTLNRYFPPPRGTVGTSIQQPWQTTNYGLVGTAFDYLLRFWLAHTIPSVHTRSRWVAETGMEMLSSELFEDEGLPDEAEGIVEEARTERDAYVEEGDLKDRLIELTLDLARLDWVYRNGAKPTGLGQYDERDVMDLRRLVELLYQEAHLEGQEAYLNPTFGIASSMVGGADADVLLDHTLIDVKVTKQERVQESWWLQLVGYALLADIDQILNQRHEEPDEESESTSLPQIETLGIYFARHGESWTVPASRVYEYSDYEAVRAWFVDKALNLKPSTPGEDALREVFCSPYDYADIPQRARSEERSPEPANDNQTTFGDFTE